MDEPNTPLVISDNTNTANTNNQELPHINVDNQSDTIIELTLDYMLSLKIYLELEFNLQETTDLYIIRHLFNFLKDMNIDNDRIKTAINLLYENINPEKLDEINHMLNRLMASNRMYDFFSLLTSNIINHNYNYNIPITPTISSNVLDNISSETDSNTETEQDEMPPLEMQIDAYTGDIINPANILNIFNTNLNNINNINNIPILLYPNSSNLFFNSLILNNFNNINNIPDSIIRHGNGKETLSESALDTISKIITYNDLDSDTKTKFNTCYICLDDFKEENIIRQINCNHIFHKTCIDPWLLNESYKCPVCRGNTTSDPISDDTSDT